MQGANDQPTGPAEVLAARFESRDAAEVVGRQLESMRRTISNGHARSPNTRVSNAIPDLANATLACERLRS
jgi:hypothetical protein